MGPVKADTVGDQLSLQGDWCVRLGVNVIGPYTIAESLAGILIIQPVK